MSLKDVERLAAERAKVDAAYRSAIVGESLAGTSLGKLAKATGLSREGVRKLVATELAKVPAVETMRARLAELDGRFQALIDTVARPDLPLGDSLRREQASRNGQAKRRRRKKLGPLPTVRADIAAQAEAEILNRLLESPDDAFCRRVVGELAEAESLREALAPHLDDDIPF